MKRHATRYSQHFLNSAKIARRIVEGARIEGHVVVEIGPGKGILTRAIADKAARVFAIELDERMIDGLEILSLPNVQCVHGDFLEHDIGAYGPVVIVGNIPYAVSTAIVEKIASCHATVLGATLTVQQEFARRLFAQPGTRPYGFLTVYANWYFEIKKAFNIAARFFTPAPRVSSTVVRMAKRKPPHVVANESGFFGLVRGVFRYPRKSLKNALLCATGRVPTGIEERILKKRPAALSVDDLYSLYTTVRERHSG